MRTRKAVAPKLTEAQLQAFGTQLLELDGWRSLRTDPVSDRRRGKGFGEVGMADYLYIRYWTGCIDQSAMKAPIESWAQVLWVEWKSKGGKSKMHQIFWQNAERVRGGLVWVAGLEFEAIPEGFKAYYLASGLNRSIRP